MRVIPVIDLMNGHVVRGVAGRRSEYRPIESQIAADSRPETVARAFVERFVFNTAYVADLDAIMHRQPNSHAWEIIVERGLTLWLDAGVGTPKAVAALDDQLSKISTNVTIVVGLESLVAPGILIDLVGQLASRFSETKLTFSLDLQRGRPVTRINWWNQKQPIEFVRWITNVGVHRLIVLDLADVGVSGGTGTLVLCRQIRKEFPELELVAGGGVRGIDDLKALADSGCDAALVASALHDGKLTPDDVRVAESWAR